MPGGLSFDERNEVAENTRFTEQGWEDDDEARILQKNGLCVCTDKGKHTHGGMWCCGGSFCCAESNE